MYHVTLYAPHYFLLWEFYYWVSTLVTHFTIKAHLLNKTNIKTTRVKPSDKTSRDLSKYISAAEVINKFILFGYSLILLWQLYLLSIRHVYSLYNKSSFVYHN